MAVDAVNVSWHLRDMDNVTDEEVLELGRTCGEGAVRKACIIALGLIESTETERFLAFNLITTQLIRRQRAGKVAP